MHVVFGTKLLLIWLSIELPFKWIIFGSYQRCIGKIGPSGSHEKIDYTDDGRWWWWWKLTPWVLHNNSYRFLLVVCYSSVLIPQVSMTFNFHIDIISVDGYFEIKGVCVICSDIKPLIMNTEKSFEVPFLLHWTNYHTNAMWSPFLAVNINKSNLFMYFFYETKIQSRFVSFPWLPEGPILQIHLW